MKTFHHMLLGLAVAIVGTAGIARAGSAEEKFRDAYYLENAQGDLTSAAKLYDQVASDRKADDALRGKAKARLAAVKEEIASEDFTRLMPPEALAYVELRKPGDQILKLVDKLGLLGDPNQLPEAGAQKLAISPELVKEILGIRGIAAAVTGFNPITQKPSGVAVFNPGDLGAIRGLIQTGLPVAGQPVEAIHGYPAYDIEGQVTVALTNRLVIAGTDRSLIEGVLARLTGKQKRSLADSEALADIGAERDDALLLFFVNAKPLIPFITTGIAASAGQQELAIAQAVLDIGSLQSLTGKLALGEDGLGLNLALRLDEGHKNLAFNFFRTPPINPETLKCVPQGAAAFWIGALNEAPSRFGGGSASTGARPPISALDIGREIFCNISSIAAFVMPPGEGTAEGGMPIPDVGLAITVNDPAKSEALWTEILGLASIATGTGTMEGTPVTIDKVDVRTYRVPDGPVIHFTSLGNDLLIATSRYAMAHAIEAKRDGTSVYEDPAFTKALKRVGPDTTRALFVHAGRVAEMAKQFVPPRELKDIGPALDLLGGTAASVVMDYSDRLFRVSVAVTGVPDVSDFVAQAIGRQKEKHERHAELTRAVKHGTWEEAIKAIDEQLAEDPDNLPLVREKFNVLALKKKDRDEALVCGAVVFAKARDNATALNNMAWALLTDEKYDGQFNELALKMSERSNELTGHKNWMFLDTLAVAKFKNGDVDEAIELEKKAIDRCDSDNSVAELKKTLKRFERKRGDS